MTSTLDIAWLAGLLEGEGSFFVKTRSPFKITVSMSSTDHDVLLRAQRIAGGTITGPVTRTLAREGTKPVWCWTVNRRADAAALMMSVLPFLGERRATKVREVLAEWRSAPIVRRRAA